MFYIIAFILLVFLEQVIKLFVYNNAFLQSGNSVVFIDGLVSFQYVENRGAAFGMLQGNIIFLIIVSFLIIFSLIYFLKKYNITDKILKILIVLIISGGTGNLIDRVFRGFVIDYIKFDFISFPVFNLADVFVFFGCFLLGYHILFKMK